jgi:hypothetical protein
MDGVNKILSDLPSAQPEPQNVTDTNVGNNDLISRQAAIDVLEERLKANGYSNATLVSELNRCIGYLMRLPSADVQPRETAEWVYGEKDGADGWYCSKCGFHIPWYYDYYGLKNINFIRDFHTCPHCDAKMMKYTGMEEVT